MNREERNLLLSERGVITRLLGLTPPSNVLDQKVLQSRLRSLDSRLESGASEVRPPARSRILYRGRPVVGARGVFAEFGLSATHSFADAVSMLAAGVDGPLAPAGRIPNREQNQLLIAGTAVGSFGFELEEHREQPPLMDEDSAVAQALLQAQTLLEATVGSDDELTEATAGIEPRALTAIRSFLSTLATNEAVCTIEVGDRSFGFKDVGQVRSALERIRQENIREEKRRLVGEFQGVLPRRRTFEFKVVGDEGVITGKIGAGVSDVDALNKHLYSRTTIDVSSYRAGGGRARYVLNEEPKW